MFKLSKKTSRPGSRPVTLRTIGAGDGKTEEFTLPDHPHVLVYAESYQLGVEYTRGQVVDGEVEKQTGVVYEGDFGEGTVKISPAPKRGTNVTAVLLDSEGEEGELTFWIFPQTIGMSKQLTERIEKLKKDRKLKPDQQLDGTEQYEILFDHWVEKWKGVEDVDTGKEMECTVETRKRFLEHFDGGLFGTVAFEAAQHLQKIAALGEETEAKN